MVFVTVRRVFQKIKLSKKQPERVLKIEFEADFVPKSFFFNIEDTNNLESFEAKLCEVGRIMKKAVVENEKTTQQLRFFN